MAAQEGKVRFIRVRGKVIPIKDDGKATVQKALKGVAIGKMGSKYMKKTAKRDEKLSKQGVKAGRASLVVAAAGAVASKFTKHKGMGLLVAGIGAMSALSLYGFAEGRSTSSKVRRMAAKDLVGEKIDKKKAPAPLGAATQRAYKEWAHIKKQSTGF